MPEYAYMPEESVQSSSWAGTAGQLIQYESPFSVDGAKNRPVVTRHRATANEEIGARTEPMPRISQAISRVNDLLRLPRNWNSYGAPALDIESAKAALELLVRAGIEQTDLPVQIVPTTHGGVQLEWLGHSGELEVSIELPRVSVFLELAQHPEQAQERETSIGLLASELPALIAQVA
jgi:hypothetical protein